MLKIEKLQETIEFAKTKLESLTVCQRDQLERQLDISPREMCLYQEVKSIAQAEGKIDLNSAMLIYNSLGNWHKTDLATKVILTQLFIAFLSPNPATNQVHRYIDGKDDSGHPETPTWL